MAVASLAGFVSKRTSKFHTPRSSLSLWEKVIAALTSLTIRGFLAKVSPIARGRCEQIGWKEEGAVLM